MRFLYLLIIGLITSISWGQHKIQELWITDDFTLHIVAPEDIEYVDISTNELIGDVPVENILRLKYQPDDIIEGVKIGNEEKISVATVTIVGQSFMTTYRINYTPSRLDLLNYKNYWEIQPEQMVSIAFPKITMTKEEMKKNSLEIVKYKGRFNNVKSKGLGLEMFLNNIITIGDYVFVDITIKNKTNLKYDIDQFRFKIQDKKINKATNVQELEIKADYILYNQKYFKKNHRNVFVFKKFTFPNNKVLNIQISEEQISGRMLELKIDYSDLLNADSF